MIVGYSNNNLLLIAIVADDVAQLVTGAAIDYHGFNMLTRDIVVLYAPTKELLLERLQALGVEVDTTMQAKYLKGERTDQPRRVS